MFEQFSNTIKATLYDRVSSPLSSSFLVSWCLWNYKILIVLFSSMKPYDKYNEIDILISNYGFSNSLFEPLGYWFSNGFLYPLLSAVIYLFIYPKPSRWVYEHWLNNEKLLKDLKDKADEAKLLSEAESKIIKKTAFDMELKYIDFMASKEALINENRNQLYSAREEIKNVETQRDEFESKYLDYSRELEVKTNELNDLNGKLVVSENICESLEEELSVYREKNNKLNEIGFKMLSNLINSSNNTISHSNLINSFKGAERVRAEDDLSKFIEDGYLAVLSQNGQGSPNLKLTAAGREYYKSNI